MGFHQDLEELRSGLLRLSAMVAEAIGRSAEILLAGNLREAQELIDADDQIDALSIELEDKCHHILALQQPVAGDLRAVITAVRLISEVERTGDLAVNVAKASRRLYGVDLDPRVRGLIERMSDEATRLFRLGIDAYAESNAGLAAALDDIDDRLDDLHVTYIEAIFESHHQAGLALENAVQLALVGRYFERIGDHAVNIGNRVRYMVTGWLPEQTGAARVQARRAALAAIEGGRSDEDDDRRNPLDTVPAALRVATSADDDDGD